jgi:hypothetical protein
MKKIAFKIETDRKPKIRIPIPRTGGEMKDKKKYNRKRKHRTGWE